MSVVRSALGVRVVTIAGVAAEQACPDCGVYSGRVHGRWMQAVKDLPYGGSLQVRWDTRRFACGETACPRRTFTEVPDQLLEEAGWRRSDPWMTSFVDLDPDRPGAGGVGSRPLRGAVAGWLDRQSVAFRAGIEVVAIDPSAPFAAAVRRTLPAARLVVDHWHLHRLANLMLTRVRQRVTQQVHGHRGRRANDACCCGPLGQWRSICSRVGR